MLTECELNGIFFFNEKDGMIMDPASEIRTMSEAKLNIRGEPKETTWAEMQFIVSGDIINSNVFKGY